MEWLPIVLLVAGLLLIGMEVTILPGTTFVGGLGAVLLLVAVGLAFYLGGFTTGVLLLLAALLLTGLLLFLSYRMGWWEGLRLTFRLPPDREARKRYTSRTHLLGQEGTAITPLRPTGVAEINGERVEVTTEGEYIAAGSRVRVMAVDRRHVFVRLAT